MSKTKYRVFRLQDRFSICKSNVWGVWRGENLVFHGSAMECEDWLDAKENENRSPQQVPNRLRKYVRRIQGFMMKSLGGSDEISRW